MLTICHEFQPCHALLPVAWQQPLQSLQRNQSLMPLRGSDMLGHMEICTACMHGREQVT